MLSIHSQVRLRPARFLGSIAVRSLGSIVPTIAITVLVLAGCRAATTKQSTATSPALEPAAGEPIPWDPIPETLAHVRDLLDSGRADSAIAFVAPRLIAAPPPLDSRLPRALVLACNEAGRSWEGARIIDELLRLRPTEIALVLARGELEFTRGRPEVALRYFQRAIVADDTSAEAMGAFGRCRAVAGGSMEIAITYFDKVVKAKPGLASPRYGKGALLLEAGKFTEAIEEFRWAIGLNPTLWLAERDAARALLRLADHEGAVGHYENAIRLVDAAGDPLTAERLAGELRTAVEEAGKGAPPPAAGEKGEKPRG